MYVLVLIVHLFVSLILIAVILLQAGRGGGLADMFGGGGAQAALGTRASAYLTRATTICAVVFLFSSLTLASLSSRQGGSIMERNAGKFKPPATKAATPAQPGTETAAPAPEASAPAPTETTAPSETTSETPASAPTPPATSETP